MSAALKLMAVFGFVCVLFMGHSAAQDAKPEVTDDKPKATVEFAKTWEAAVIEAKLLNVPLVVHSHGFY
ncbi:MAG: hypothetical protein EXS14_09490 [Planctomycetes bacterium]|nr:hypothetical protein [Planctomycetota bacterium]